jgi:hypothetical protein
MPSPLDGLNYIVVQDDRSRKTGINTLGCFRQPSLSSGYQQPKGCENSDKAPKIHLMAHLCTILIEVKALFGDLYLPNIKTWQVFST